LTPRRGYRKALRFVKFLTIKKIEVLLLQEKKMGEKEKNLREIIYHKNHFEDFYTPLDSKLKNKIIEVFRMIRSEKQISNKFFKQITGVKDLYEIRIRWSNNIYRIFCCLDKGKLVILFNGFMKKTQETPKREIDKAKRLMKEYFKEKENGNKK